MAALSAFCVVADPTTADAVRAALAGVVPDAVVVVSAPDRARRLVGDDVASLARAESLAAAGTQRRDVAHALNNPLTALLTEAQLLELDELPPDATAAVRRIVGLCRRVITELKSV